MLSRAANNLYWMSRHIERAENTARLLDVTYRNLGMKHTEASVPQLVATLAYIHRRHLTPCKAWSHFKEKNYY